MHALAMRIPQLKLSRAPTTVARSFKFQVSCAESLCKRHYTTDRLQINPHKVIQTPELSQPVRFRTLYRGWLQPEDYVDLSDARGVIVGPDGSADVMEPNAGLLTYARTDRMLGNQQQLLKYQPFPVGTRGFFYLWTHPAIPVASALRFRLTPSSDPKTFDQGYDLLTEYGTPWNVPILAIANGDRFNVLQDLLVRDQIVPEKFLKACRGLIRQPKGPMVGPWSQLVFQLNELFYLDLSRPTSSISLVGMNGIDQCLIGEWFPKHSYPFKSGVILCKFEPHRKTPQQKNVSLRVRRIIEPVQFADGHDGRAGMPLVDRIYTYEGKSKPFLGRERTDRLGHSIPSRYTTWASVSDKWRWMWYWHELKKECERGWKYPWNDGAEEAWRQRLAAPERVQPQEVETSTS